MAHTPTDLLALIDTYAAAREAREASVELAAWAFEDAHTAMITARAAVIEALGIADVAPALSDERTTLAEWGIARTNEWRSRVNALLETER